MQAGFLFEANSEDPATRTTLQEETMAKETVAKQNTGGDKVTKSPSTRSLSLDGWAVATALALAALVRLGVLKHITW